MTDCGYNVRWISGNDISDNLIDRIIPLLCHRIVHKLKDLFDLHLRVIVNIKVLSAVNICHIFLPLHALRADIILS